MRLASRLLLGLLFFSALPRLSAQDLSASERDALIELYVATNGTGWVQSQNWLGAPGTEGSWHGVTVAAGHVTQIRLEANNLVGPLPSSLGHLPQLRELRLGSPASSLSPNRLESIPVAIGVLDQLELLDLSSTRISALPRQLGELAALRTLILSSNLISRLPDEIGDLQSLRRLELGNNAISELPATLGNLLHLRVLNAQQNQIASLPESIGNLAALEDLNLAGNRLTELPASMAGLSALKRLVLASNGIAALPPSFGSLIALQELDLGNNALRSLAPEQVGGLIQLRTLDLTLNQLDFLPPELGNLTNLTELYVGGNDLTGLPETIGNLTQLRNLVARSNRIEDLPEGLGGMQNLRELDLFDNRLEGIPDAIGNLTQLERLELACNDIAELPETVGDLGSLVALSVADNALAAFPPGLTGLDRLERLNLRGNRLTGEVAAGLTNLDGLIRPNPQIVDSFLDLRWNGLAAEGPELTDFLTRSQIGDFASTQTVPPEGLRLAAINGSSALLEWQPIQFQSSDGGYEVFESTRPDGPFVFVGRTSSKSEGGFTVAGLDPSREYFFSVRALSLPHQANRNSILSEPSSTLAGTTTEVAELYFPFLDSSADGFNGIAVANHGVSDATLDFSILGIDGQPLDLPRNPVSARLPSGGQLALLESDIFGSTTPSPVGWLRLTSDSGRLGAVFLAGDSARLDGAAAVRSQTPRFWFPIVLEGPLAYRGQDATTTISVANPNNDPVELELKLVSTQPDGERTTRTATRQLPPLGLLRETIDQLFAEAAPPGSYVEVTVVVGAGAVGFSWIEFADGRSTVGLSAVAPTGELNGYLAQWASSPDLFSDLQLVNTSMATRELTLRVVGRDGAPLGDPVVVQLEGGAVLTTEAGSFFETTDDAQTGSLEVTVDGFGVIGDVLYGDPAELAFAAASPLRGEPFLQAEFSHAADDAGIFTGLALWNVGGQEAEVTIEVLGAGGTPLGSAVRRLPPGGRLEELLRNLIPVTAGLRAGRVLVHSSQPLIGEEIFGDYELSYLSSLSPDVLQVGPHLPIQVRRSCRR